MPNVVITFNYQRIGIVKAAHGNIIAVSYKAFTKQHDLMNSYYVDIFGNFLFSYGSAQQLILDILCLVILVTNSYNNN